MKQVTVLTIEFQFLRGNRAFLNTSSGFLNFPHLTMAVKISTTKTSVRLQLDFTGDALTVSSTSTKTFITCVDQPPHWNCGPITNTVTSLDKFAKKQVCRFLVRCRQFFRKADVKKRTQSIHFTQSEEKLRLPSSPQWLRSNPSSSNQ